MSTTDQPKPVRISVSLEHPDYIRLEAVKARLRKSTQDLASAWILRGVEEEEKALGIASP